MATLTTDILMKKTINELIELCLTQNNTINELRQRKANNAVIETNKKVRKENTDLKRELQKYKTLAGKINKVGEDKQQQA